MLPDPAPSLRRFHCHWDATTHTQVERGILLGLSLVPQTRTRWRQKAEWADDSSRRGEAKQCALATVHWLLTALAPHRLHPSRSLRCAALYVVSSRVGRRGVGRVAFTHDAEEEIGSP
jgi:hypothetical protein